MATTEQIYDQAIKNRVSTAPAFTWADWTQYQTARFDDWSLWMMNASTWQLASWYYDDSVRGDIKRQFMEWTYNQATTQNNIPVNQNVSAPLWTSQPQTPNLYAMTQDQLQWQKSQVMQDYYSAVSWFNKQSMADELRLKTWWTVDVDKQIKTERDKLNSLLPELMQKYAHLDPNQRDVLIRQEEQWIRNSINNLEAIREYRVWTIQDILARDIAKEEQKINWLEMAYKMYSEVLWDQREADKLKREIEKEAMQMEKMRLELEQYKKILPLEERQAKLKLSQMEEEAWVEWKEWIMRSQNFKGIDFSNQQDLLQQASKNNEASIKNNNPTWMTWGISNDLKRMLDEAWVQYTQWTSRPENEWWNYIKFATVEDGMKAYQIALTQRWDDIYERLKKWVWTSNADNYATALMKEAWIQKWEKFSSLDPTKLEKLMDAQLRQESPVFARALLKSTEALPITEAWWWKTEAWYTKTNTETSNLFDSKWKPNYSIVNDYTTFEILQNNTSEDIIKWLNPNQLSKVLKTDTNFSLINKVLDEKSDISKKISDEIRDEYIMKYDINEINNIDTEEWLYSYILELSWLEDKDIGKETIDNNTKNYILDLLNETWKKDLIDTWKWIFNLASEYYKNLKKIWLY